MPATTTLQPPTIAALQSSEEALPVLVRIAESAHDRAELCQLRSKAYRRPGYNPELAERLSTLDANDHCGVLLVAIDKVSKRVIGTLRLRSTLRSPIQLHAGMDVSELADDSFAYLDRFAVEPGPLSEIAMMALLKAQAYWVAHEQVSWVIAAALPPMVRRYRRLGLRVLKGAEEGFFVLSQHPEKYASLGERAHQIPPNIHRASPRLAQFLFGTHHPDIQVPRPKDWERWAHP